MTTAEAMLSINPVEDPVPPLARGRILVVEDEPSNADLLDHILVSHGYEVWTAQTGAQAEAILERHRPDLVLLDLLLPDVDGLVLCSQIRARWSARVVVVSGTQRYRDRILSLRLGADDFIAKPFDVSELLARVDTALRRQAADRRDRALSQDIPTIKDTAPAVDAWTVSPRATGREAVRFRELAIDARRRSVKVGDRPIHLTPTENRLLTMMAAEPERVFSRPELAHELWGPDSLGQSRAIDVHIRRLRAKLEPFGQAAPPIVTVRGFGYKLGLDAHQTP